MKLADIFGLQLSRTDIFGLPEVFLDQPRYAYVLSAPLGDGNWYFMAQAIIPISFPVISYVCLFTYGCNNDELIFLGVWKFLELTPSPSFASTKQQQ